MKIDQPVGRRPVGREERRPRVPDVVALASRPRPCRGPRSARPRSCPNLSPGPHRELRSEAALAHRVGDDLELVAQRDVAVPVVAAPLARVCGLPVAGEQRARPRSAWRDVGGEEARPVLLQDLVAGVLDQPPVMDSAPAAAVLDLHLPERVAELVARRRLRRPRTRPWRAARSHFQPLPSRIAVSDLVPVDQDAPALRRSARARATLTKCRSPG